MKMNLTTIRVGFLLALAHGHGWTWGNEDIQEWTELPENWATLITSRAEEENKNNSMAWTVFPCGEGDDTISHQTGSKRLEWDVQATQDGTRVEMRIYRPATSLMSEAIQEKIAIPGIGPSELSLAIATVQSLYRYRERICVAKLVMDLGPDIDTKLSVTEEEAGAAQERHWEALAKAFALIGNPWDTDLMLDQPEGFRKALGGLLFDPMDTQEERDTEIWVLKADPAMLAGYLSAGLRYADRIMTKVEAQNNLGAEG